MALHAGGLCYIDTTTVSLSPLKADIKETLAANDVNNWGEHERVPLCLFVLFVCMDRLIMSLVHMYTSTAWVRVHTRFAMSLAPYRREQQHVR